MLQEDTMSHLMRQREIYSEEIAYLNSLKKDHLDVQARLES